jgi:hypothetical protein
MAGAVTLSIRVATSPGEARIAVLEGNRLVDFALWRPGAPDGVGDMHRGRVISLVPAMAGAFVALADAEGFLPDSEGAKGLTVGTILTVRITRAAQGSKGPRLTTRQPVAGCLSVADAAASDRVAADLSAAGPAAADGPLSKGPVALLRRGPNPVSRFAALYPHASIVVDDSALAARLQLEVRTPARSGGGRNTAIASIGNGVSASSHRAITVQSGTIFDEDVAEAIDALTRPVVTLAGGARVSIWPTPALVAIDVDAAGALARSGGSGGARSRQEALNRAAVPEVAHQIRLRNLSGGIVVDLAGLSPRKRAALAPDFIAAMAKDPTGPKFLGFTALGLAEIVRPRIHPPLHELLSGPFAAGLAALRAVTGGFGQDPRGLPAVRAHPAVVSALQNDPAALPDLARRVGREVTLRSDPSLPATVWVLEKDND